MNKVSRILLEEWLKIPRSVKMFCVNVIIICFFLFAIIKGLNALFELSIDLPVLLVAAIVSLLFMIIHKKFN